MTANSALRATRARFYETVRTAHLERAHQLEPAAIVYRQRRYDFDEATADGLELHRRSPAGAARLMLSAQVREVEVNEPMSSEIRFTAMALLGLDLRRLIGRGRATVTAYAIANMDPVEALRAYRGPKARVRAVLHTVLSRYVWRRLDRVVYGTDSARDLYHARFPRRRIDEWTIPALPVARTVADEVKQAGTVVFLGALVDRKGFPLVLDAWPLVRQERPDARLTILGKGALLQRATDAAASDDSITLAVDPPRETIFSVLDRSAVLVLPSQAGVAWREQVGLPIVEGLASGCAIVTTTETGLAEWLAAHGHGVVAADADARTLADAIVAQLDAGRPASALLADLPPTDGRLEADRWLFRATR